MRLFAGEEQEKEKPVREIKRERGGVVGERSLNPRPKRNTIRTRGSNTGARRRNAHHNGARRNEGGRKEGKKERKKERAHPFDVSFARGIYKLLRRETWILCEEGGGSQKSFGQSGRSKIINFVFLPFFKRP